MPIEMAFPDDLPSVSASLVNSDGKVIGTADWSRDAINTGGVVHYAQLTISANANDITDKLTLKVTSSKASIPVTPYDFSNFDQDALKYTDSLELKNKNGWQFEWNLHGGVTAVGYRGSSKKPKIPEEVGRWKVTALGTGGSDFGQLSGLSPIIPKTVTRIEAYTFHPAAEGAPVIHHITIPDSVTYIGKKAFYENALREITIPKSVVYIGEEAFQDNQLTHVTIPDTVRFIGAQNPDHSYITGAFSIIGYTDNPLIRSVTLPANRDWQLNDIFAIQYNYKQRLQEAYDANGRKAGTYIRAKGGKWHLKGGK
jgi:hypothetical protein